MTDWDFHEEYAPCIHPVQIRNPWWRCRRMKTCESGLRNIYSSGILSQPSCEHSVDTQIGWNEHGLHRRCWPSFPKCPLSSLKHNSTCFFFTQTRKLPIFHTKSKNYAKTPSPIFSRRCFFDGKFFSDKIHRQNIPCCQMRCDSQKVTAVSEKKGEKTVDVFHKIYLLFPYFLCILCGVIRFRRTHRNPWEIVKRP